MPYHGGLEDHEHLKQQAADAQRRAQRRMATRRAAAPGGRSAASPRPWWAFWRRWKPGRGAATADTPSSTLHR